MSFPLVYTAPLLLFLLSARRLVVPLQLHTLLPARQRQVGALVQHHRVAVEVAAQDEIVLALQELLPRHLHVRTRARRRVAHREQLAGILLDHLPQRKLRVRLENPDETNRQVRGPEAHDDGSNHEIEATVGSFKRLAAPSWALFFLVWNAAVMIQLLVAEATKLVAVGLGEKLILGAAASTIDEKLA